MGKEVGGIVVIMGSVGLIYLVASGNLDSAWRGIRGECGCPVNGNNGQDTGQNLSNVGMGGHAMRGSFYSTPIGQMFVTDAGQY